MEDIFGRLERLCEIAKAQALRIEDLETRCTSLERRLRDRDAEVIPERPLLRVVERDEIEGVPA